MGCGAVRGAAWLLALKHFQADATAYVAVRGSQVFLGDAEAGMAMRTLGDEGFGHGEATARE